MTATLFAAFAAAVSLCFGYLWGFGAGAIDKAEWFEQGRRLGLRQGRDRERQRHHMLHAVFAEAKDAKRVRDLEVEYAGRN